MHPSVKFLADFVELQASSLVSRVIGLHFELVILRSQAFVAQGQLPAYCRVGVSNSLRAACPFVHGASSCRRRRNLVAN